MLVLGAYVVDRRGFPQTDDVLVRAAGRAHIPGSEIIADCRMFFTPLDSLARLLGKTRIVHYGAGFHRVSTLEEAIL